MEDKERTKLKREPHPREHANIFSKVFFCWALPFFVKGLKKDLTEDDLYGPLKSHNAETLGSKIEDAWDQETKKGSKLPLLRAIVRVFGKEAALFGVVIVIQELIVKMAQPYVLGKLLSFYVPNQTNMSKSEAYIYAFLIVFTTFIDLLISNSLLLSLMHLGMKIRIACSSLIYRKSLRLSRSALAETTVGQMVNLISNDVTRLQGIFLQIHHIWIGPIAAAVTIYLLYTTVHPAALVGIILLVLFIPVQAYLVKKMSQYRRQIALKTDNRIKLMSEIIGGIQVIKMYTWEKSFAKLIEAARTLELDKIKAMSYIRAINLSFMSYLSRIAIYFCILAYVLPGNQLQAQYVFVTTSYYNILRELLIIWLPRGITVLTEAYVSIGRIEEFLNHDEMKMNEKINLYQNDSKLIIEPFCKPVQNLNFGIKAEKVSVKWPSSLDNTLSDINFSATENQLVAIIGPVGSGKSTLFHVFLNELTLTNGKLDVNGTISYASQQPWLFSGSIRQNILFGNEMYEKKYDEVIKVCALQRDFSLFPYGDRTLIGERGIMLSGGQKARINLARAIYRDADIYLLDDPLSAVDTHVGKHLFDECISGYLKNKCVVLITHQLQYLRTVDKIYLLENGSITTSGNYLELQNNKEKFVRLLQSQPSMTEEENSDSANINNALKSLKLPTEIKEERSTGKVARKIYKDYITAGGSFCGFIVVIILFILAQLLGTATQYFLTFWVNIEQERYERSNMNTTINITETSMERFFNSENCIIVYTLILILLIILGLCRSFSILKFCLNASENLHNTMFAKIALIPMRFFHTNPSGRVLNRFSRDVGIVDENLPSSINDTIHVGLTVLSITIVVATLNPWILLPTIFIFGLFYVYRMIFLATSRDLKRVASTTRSPIFTHLTTSIQGLTTIRAFNSEKILRTEFHNHQNLHTSAAYMYMGCSRTFAFYLDITCIIYITFVTFSFLFMGTETYGGNVGLAITQSIGLTRMLQWGMRQWSDLENEMTSVERIVEYTEMTPETDNGMQKPSNYWPNSGSIEFRNVSLRYSLDSAQVLKDVNFKIRGTEKIGIVGRTGAGKSSLISALFRLTQIEGIIIIDGFSIKEIALKKLRSKISIIPQDPVLFSGTLRKNLDPFEEFEDRILWNALEEVELKKLISDIPTGLQCNVSESGTNFSVGQRQLLCLARAIIRNNKILVLDEATANVDPQTDELIQATIRRKFSECTVLTIAHRLNTVMDCDRILVMDAGCVVEFDHPYKLLQNSNGVLHSLVKQTGRGMSENLIKIAEKNYEHRKQTTCL